MVCWEVMLSKGQEWDWLGDPFLRVQTLMILFVLGLSGLIYRELRLAQSANRSPDACRSELPHLLHHYLLRLRRALRQYQSRLPALLQSLFGYDATTSGLVLSPAGVFAIAMLLVVGAVLSRGVDARYLMAGGIFTMAFGNYWMAHLNLEISPFQVVWPQGSPDHPGCRCCSRRLTSRRSSICPKEMRGAAVGLLALLRNEGGSVGTSVAQIIQERRDQFHTLRLNESLDKLNQPVNDLLAQGQAFFLQHTGDPPLSHQMAVGSS